MVDIKYVYRRVTTENETIDAERAFAEDCGRNESNRDNVQWLRLRCTTC
jgi:erythromycin esterase-like protein